MNKPSPLDVAREYFKACPTCKPVGCCNGQECGCQGMPVEFEATIECGDDCLNKVWQERKELKRVLVLARNALADCGQCDNENYPTFQSICKLI